MKPNLLTRAVNFIKQNAFDWEKTESETSSPARISARRPHKTDYSNDLVANQSLTRGIYHGEYPGLKLASAFAFPMIAIPVYFMGFPSFKVEDKRTQEVIDELHGSFITEMERLHIECHREGSIWPWAKYTGGKLQWEFISDASMTDLITSLDTDEIIRMYTDDNLTVRTTYNQTTNIRRIRTFTDTKVEVKYTGGLIPDGIKDRSSRNVGGLPVGFLNNADSDEHRGHSDYARVLSDLKDYHDLDYAEVYALSKFVTKMVQKVKDVNTWLNNNGLTSSSTSEDDSQYLELQYFQPEKTDFIINMADEETKFIFADRVTTGYEEALKRKFRKIVVGSGTPELVLGVKTEGNANTAEEQMATLVQYVQDKRRQKQESYLQLWRNTLRVWEIANGTNLAYDDLVIEWNQLDSVSDKVKSEIFLNFTRGLAAVTTTASLSKEQMFKLWEMNFPTATEEDFAVWMDGVGATIAHNIALQTGSVTDPGLLGDEDEMLELGANVVNMAKKSV